MGVEVRIPSALRTIAGGERVVSATGTTVGQLIDDLDGQYPGLKERLLSPNGEPHQFVNLYINDEDIRFLNQLKTPVKEGDVLSILPALAGGDA